jgi:hypothetical protein
MKFFRAPHDIIALPGGMTAFDICEAQGYHYLRPALDFTDEHEDAGARALRAVRASLERDPDSLSGMILALRDGLSYRRAAPVADALRQILELLERHRYRVVGVGELVARSPFEDLPPAHACFEAVRRLDRAGFVTGFRNNRFYPERDATLAEVTKMLKKPGSRERAVVIGKKNELRPRVIAAMAEEVFNHVLGAPRSASRADIAVWLSDLADVNGFFPPN